MASTNAGYQVFSADGAVVSSGSEVIVHGINFTSGGTAGVVILRNGTSASATAVIQENGIISSSKTQLYKPGIVFPAGCFVDIDANVSSATIFYEAV